MRHSREKESSQRNHHIERGRRKKLSRNRTGVGTLIFFNRKLRVKHRQATTGKQDRSPCHLLSRLQRLLWIYCSGHGGVSGNERADRLASTAEITSGLQLGGAEVLRGLRYFLNTDKPEHHCIHRLKERGVEKGSGRHSTLQGQERSVFNQANIGTVSRATLGRLLRDGAERVWACPRATMPS